MIRTVASSGESDWVSCPKTKPRRLGSVIQIGIKGYLTGGIGQQQSAVTWSGELDLASLTPEQTDTYEKGQESRRKTEAWGARTRWQRKKQD